MAEKSIQSMADTTQAMVGAVKGIFITELPGLMSHARASFRPSHSRNFVPTGPARYASR